MPVTFDRGLNALFPAYECSCFLLGLRTLGINNVLRRKGRVEQSHFFEFSIKDCFLDNNFYVVSIAVERDKISKLFYFTFSGPRANTIN